MGNHSSIVSAKDSQMKNNYVVVRNHDKQKIVIFFMQVVLNCYNLQYYLHSLFLFCVFNSFTLES